MGFMISFAKKPKDPNMTDKPVFRFNLKVVLYDPSGYYYTKWQEAVPVSVNATDADEARGKAVKSMGKPPSGRAWTASLEGVSEVSF